MRKELKSYLDGHHEYEMTCQDKQMCDGGSDLTIPFGKRDLESRDISITCCADDLCNFPGSTQTFTGCPRDVIFLVDGGSDVVMTQHSSVLNTILAVTHRLDIGMTDNLVALYTYDQTTHEKIRLQQYTDKSDMVSALQYQNLHGKIRGSDTHDAIQFLIDHVMTTKTGDRPSYPDAVVIITDSRHAQRVHLSVSEQRDLHRASDDVILVSVGRRYTGSLFGVTSGETEIATDRNHILHVPDLNAILNLVNSIVALINKC